MTATQPFTTKLISSNMGMFKYCWIWEKNIATGFINAKKMPLNNYEDIVVFYKKQCIYNPQYSKGEPYSIRNRRGGGPNIYNKIDRIPKESVDGKRYPLRVQRFKTVNLNTVHSTQKPIKLMQYLINTYTHQGDTVLDFTMGSGTTGCACKLTKRSFIGIELDKDYFDIACKRIKYTPYQHALQFDSSSG